MRTRLLLRSFLIQGSWNYRTMLGAGVAWALLPVFRRKKARGEPVDGEALRAHADHFNGHPYLMPLALGALAREELGGTDRERILRFRRVLPAPLGSLGDSLVWATWRPTCVVVALVLVVLGVPPLVVAAAFLAAYNAVHLTLRTWAVWAGWAEGLAVGRLLGAARFPLWTERIGRVGVVSLGLLVGTLLVAGYRALGWGGFWPAAALVVFLAGLAGGRAAARAAPALVLLLVLAGLL